MYLIKACPSCKKKLRFPIDKGTISIKYSCGYSFIADPDDIDIYKNAVFDLSRSRCALMTMTPLTRAIGGIKFNRIVPGIITSGLELKYKLQNFKLLPGDEKRKIILITAMIVAGIAGLVIALRLIFAAFASQENVII